MPDPLAMLGTAVPYVPVAVRKYQTITPDEFDLALVAKEWSRCDEFNGWTSLDYERAIFLRSPHGDCFAMTIIPTEPQQYIPQPDDSVEA